MMRPWNPVVRIMSLAIVLGLVQALSCVPQCEDVHKTDVGLRCDYNGSVVYEGTFETAGHGVASVLSGRWTLTNQSGVTCTVEL